MSPVSELLTRVAETLKVECSPLHAVITVEPAEDVSLEGFTDCNVSSLIDEQFLISDFALKTFNDATTAFYNSAEFQQKANESATFLSQLPPYLDGRNVTLENMVGSAAFPLSRITNCGSFPSRSGM
jgi:hypothetical protein